MTMRAIGRCVGMRASALYRHFPSKAALIEAVAAREIDVLMRRAYEQNEKSKPPRNLIRVLDMMIKYTRREPHMFALLRDYGYRSIQPIGKDFGNLRTERSMMPSTSSIPFGSAPSGSRFQNP